MDISRAESAFSQGSTRFKKWHDRFEEQWNRPAIKTQVSAFLANLPPEAKEEFSEQIERIEKKIGIPGVKHAKTNQEIPRPFEYSPNR